MQPILEAAAVLVVLFLVMRLSLTRKSSDLRLRGGLVALNILAGALAGFVVAIALRDLGTGSTAGGTATGAATATGGLADLGAALWRVLPLSGALIGGAGGHRLFGSLWRRYLRDGPATARAWLRRLQFLVCGASIAFLIGRWLS